MLQMLGIHQPAEWSRSRFRGAVHATVSASRLRRLSSGVSVSREGSEDEAASGQGSLSEDELRRRRQDKEEARRRLDHSHLEERTHMTDILQAVGPGLVETEPGAVNELSRSGVIFITACSTLGFHFLRLLLRQVLFDAVLHRTKDINRAILKRRLSEVYLLSTFHSVVCAGYSLRKILWGRWDCPQGSQSMLCFSIGYTSYSLLTLRKQLFSDPMFAVNEIANLVKMTSCLRSKGVRWIVPLFMSAEVPLACLNVLRMMAELGTGTSTWAFQLVLGAFTSTFAVIKGVVLPGAFYDLVVRRAKEFPELHQPAFLPAKLAFLVRAVLNYAWLSAVATHWTPRRPLMPDGSKRSIMGDELPRLSDLTMEPKAARQAMNSFLSPLSVIYFVILQSFYFIAPASLPTMVYLLLRRPRFRKGAAGGLLFMLVAALWPMKVDEPFHKKPVQGISFNILGGMLRSYLSFKSVYEEPLSKDRRYLLAIIPHGVMPFAMNCLHSEMLDDCSLPNMIGASILLKVPVLRQLVRWAGMVPARKHVIDKVLQWRYPHNVTFIIPGGIAEMFYMRPDVEQVFVKRRKGFVKLALKAGVDLVPVYGLGHTHLFSTFDRQSRIGGALMQLSRWLRVSLPLSYGRWGMPLIPYPLPVVALVGRPIRIDEAIPHPTNEQVDEVHNAFVEELRRIFDKHKHLVPGYERKRLYFEDEEVPPPARNMATSDMLFPSTLPLLSSKM